MKTTIVFILVFFLCIRGTSQTKASTILYYKKKIVRYNSHGTLDTLYSYFSLKKKGSKLYFRDSTINNSVVKSKSKCIGSYIINNGQATLNFRLNGELKSLPIYDINTQVNTTYPYSSQTLSFFYQGKVQNTNTDTVITGNRYIKFSRKFSGSPGIDRPSYQCTEYVDTIDWLPVLFKIEYSKPWMSVEIIRYK